jgi:protein-disulfide isomerase
MSLNRRDLVQLSVLIAIAAMIVFLLRAHKQLGEEVSGSALARAVRNDRSSPSEESPEADVTLIVFTDYRCPACRIAHPAMKRAVQADGKVRIVYKDSPVFGALSQRAAEIALASELQGLYIPVHDRLMRGPAHHELALKKAVELSGGDWRRLESDLLKNQARIAAQLARNRRQAVQLGLPGTPGYLIGPFVVRGALSERDFQRLFHEARARGTS